MGKDVELDELPGLACSGTWDGPLYTVGILEDFLRSIPHGRQVLRVHGKRVCSSSCPYCLDCCLSHILTPFHVFKSAPASCM